MRKQTKLVAVLSAAALMAMGASMTAFADWSQEDGEWVYLDRNGDRVTDEWRRSNGQWYYLDEDRTINGRVYIFDEFGRMLDLWVYASTATNSAYFAEDEGSRGRN